MALAKRREFTINLATDLALLSVLTSVARHSGGSWSGATRDQMWLERVSANVEWDQFLSAMSEAEKHGIIVADERQTGTAGSTTTYYELAPQCTVELVIRIYAPATQVAQSAPQA